MKNHFFTTLAINITNHLLSLMVWAMYTNPVVRGWRTYSKDCSPFFLAYEWLLDNDLSFMSVPAKSQNESKQKIQFLTWNMLLPNHKEKQIWHSIQKNSLKKKFNSYICFHSSSGLGWKRRRMWRTMVLFDSSQMMRWLTWKYKDLHLFISSVTVSIYKETK